MSWGDECEPMSRERRPGRLRAGTLDSLVAALRAVEAAHRVEAYGAEKSWRKSQVDHKCLAIRWQMLRYTDGRR